MRNGAIISGLLHAGIAAALYVGVPDFAEPLPVGEPIPVEVVSVDDIARAKRPEPVETTPEPEPEPEPEPAEAEQEPPPAPQPPEPEAAPVRQAEAPAPPAPAPQPAPPEPAPQPAATPPPPAPKPKAKPTPPPKPEPETAEEPPPEPETAEAPAPPDKPRVELADRPEPEPRASRLDSILKDVLEQRAAAEPARERPPAEAERPAEERVTMSERAALVTLIRRQVERCWLVPPGVKDADKLVVELRVQLNPDGSLQRAEIVDVARLTNDAFYRTVAESALRAVKKCEPFQELPAERYSVWKDLKLTFNPENYGT